MHTEWNAYTSMYNSVSCENVPIPLALFAHKTVIHITVPNLYSWLLAVCKLECSFLCIHLAWSLLRFLCSEVYSIIKFGGKNFSISSNNFSVPTTTWPPQIPSACFSDSFILSKRLCLFIIGSFVIKFQFHWYFLLHCLICYAYPLIKISF